MPGPYSDQVKLGRELKLLLDALEEAGVSRPAVCGLLVDGEINELDDFGRMLLAKLV